MEIPCFYNSMACLRKRIPPWLACLTVLLSVVVYSSSCTSTPQTRLEATLRYMENHPDQYWNFYFAKKHLENIDSNSLSKPIIFWAMLKDDPRDRPRDWLSVCWSEKTRREYNLRIETRNSLIWEFPPAKLPVPVELSYIPTEEFQPVVFAETYFIGKPWLEEIEKKISSGKKVTIQLVNPSASSKPVSWDKIVKDVKDEDNILVPAIRQRLHELGAGDRWGVAPSSCDRDIPWP